MNIKIRNLRMVLLLTILIIFVLLFIGNNGIYGEPTFKDTNLETILVIQGLESPTSMAFLDKDNILVLEKNSGQVRLVSHGILLKQPVLKLRVDHTTLTCCRGLLGIEVMANNSLTRSQNHTKVFLYYSEKLDGKDSVRNRLYRYQWTGSSLVNPVLILDLPATPGPNHPGGKIVLGKDGYLYTVIGDLNNQGLLQNSKGNSNELTDTSVIIRINPLNGKAPEDNPFYYSGLSEKAKKYYGYGVRNSFGLAIDPLTGALWNTENGDKDYDEINLVKPGFNSGWRQIMGPNSENKVRENQLFMLPGSYYSDPVFSFAPSLGLTEIEFFNSTNLGKKYQNNIFVGDINNGNLYFLRIDSTRSGLEIDETHPGLKDLVANGDEELSQITLGTGFKGITDIRMGPDGFPYILTFDEGNEGAGKIYKIIKS